MIETRFKKTIFGRIPKDWYYCTFGDVLQTFSSGATPYRGIPNYYKGNIRWISSGELNYNRIYNTIEHISEEAKTNTHLRLHSEGTFLMAITGLEAEGTRGRCAIIGAPSTTNQSCLAINGTDKLTVDFLFWFYCFWSDFLAFKYCQGSKQQSYTANIVKRLPIYFPLTICEQQRIATALSDIDALLSALNKKIEKKKLIKQGAMQQLLTGRKRLAGFTDPWEEKRLGTGLSFKPGFPFNSNNFSNTIGVRLIRNRDLKTDDQIIYYSGSYSYDYIINNGDLLIGMDGDFLPCLWSKGLALLNQRVGKIEIVNPDWNVTFLYYYLIGPLMKKQEGTGATTVKHLSHTDIESFILKLPPTLKEQSAIATLLSDMDKEIEALEAKRTKYTQVKQGMMQQLLTGKIRLID